MSLIYEFHKIATNVLQIGDVADLRSRKLSVNTKLDLKNKMKLFLCKECEDIVRLIQDEKRVCKCGKVGGKYIDDLNAVYFGEMAVPIGFANSTLVKAVHKQPNEGMGENFTAFVIPKVCSTYKLVLEHEC